MWSVGGNLAHNVNKILKISNALEFLNSELLDEAGPNPSFLLPGGTVHEYDFRGSFT